MKTIRSYFNLLLFIPVAGLFFAGCYTHMETMRDEGSGGGGGDDYVYNDSTSSANDTTGANYFSDDDYRESNYRASFDYYCPPAYIWSSNICYDPWYDYCWYPGPYWYGYYPYWGWGYGYGLYYGGGYRGYYRGGRGGDFFAGRTRTIGSTRGGISYMRGRAPVGSPGGVPYASGGVASRTRAASVPVAGTTAVSQTRSRQEVPWWERAKASAEASSNGSRVAARTQSAGVSNQRRSVYNPSVNRANARQVNQQRGRMQPSRGGNGGGQSRQATRQGYPHYSSPQGSSGRGSGGGGSRGGGGGGRSGGGRGK